MSIHTAAVSRAATWSAGWRRAYGLISAFSPTPIASLRHSPETARHMRQNLGSRGHSGPPSRVWAAPCSPPPSPGMSSGPPAGQPPLPSHHLPWHTTPAMSPGPVPVRPHGDLQPRPAQSPASVRTDSSDTLRAPASHPAGLRTASQAAPPPSLPLALSTAQPCRPLTSPPSPPVPLSPWFPILSHLLSKLLPALQHPNGR